MQQVRSDVEVKQVYQVYKRAKELLHNVTERLQQQRQQDQLLRQQQYQQQSAAAPRGHAAQGQPAAAAPAVPQGSFLDLLGTDAKVSDALLGQMPSNLQFSAPINAQPSVPPAGPQPGDAGGQPPAKRQCIDQGIAPGAAVDYNVAAGQRHGAAAAVGHAALPMAAQADWRSALTAAGQQTTPVAPAAVCSGPELPPTFGAAPISEQHTHPKTGLPALASQADNATGSAAATAQAARLKRQQALQQLLQSLSAHQSQATSGFEPPPGFRQALPEGDGSPSAQPSDSCRTTFDWVVNTHSPVHSVLRGPNGGDAGHDTVLQRVMAEVVQLRTELHLDADSLVVSDMSSGEVGSASGVRLKLCAPSARTASSAFSEGLPTGDGNVHSDAVLAKDAPSPESNGGSALCLEVWIPQAYPESMPVAVFGSLDGDATLPEAQALKFKFAQAVATARKPISSVSEIARLWLDLLPVAGSVMQQPAGASP